MRKSRIVLVPLLLVLSYASLAFAEWIDYADASTKGSAVTFSTSSLKQFDDVHYAVTVFTNYNAVQTIELNKRKIQYESKSEIQLFGCETQDFALGDYELYQNKNATGSKTVVNQKEIIWNPVAPKTLQMELLRKFCRAI